MRVWVKAVLAKTFVISIAVGLSGFAANAADIPQYICKGFEPFWTFNASAAFSTYHRAGSSPVTRQTTGINVAGSTVTIASAHPATALLTPVGPQGCPQDPSGGAVTYSYNVTLTIGTETLKGCCK